MTTSLLSHSFCANHFWPGLYLLVPFHEVFGTTGLLVLQAAVVAAGAFPVYALALDVTKRKDWASILSICYLLHPTVSIGVLFDFHPELLSMPFLLGSYYTGRKQRYVAALLLGILAVSLYEVTALVYCASGVLLCFKSGSRRLGSMLLTLPSAYLTIIFLLIMPAFRDGLGVPHMERWWPPDISARDLRQILYLFFAVGLTPLFRMRYLLPAVPLIALLAWSNLNLQMDIRFGYIAPAVPFFFIAAVHGAKRMSTLQLPSKWNMSRYAPRIVLFMALSLFIYFHIKRPIRPDPFRLRPNLESIRAAAAQVPEHAALSADNHLGAHFAKRNILLLTPQTRYAQHSVEYILADLQEDEFKDKDWWPTMRLIIARGKYSPVFFSDGVVLLKASDGPSPLTSTVLEHLDKRATSSPSPRVTGTGH